MTHQYTPPQKQFLNILMNNNMQKFNDPIKAFLEIEIIWKDWISQNPNVVNKAGKPDGDALCKLWIARQLQK